VGNAARKASAFRLTGCAFFAVVAPLDPPERRRYIALEYAWNVLTVTEIVTRH
jgi:hypothetical protein